MRDTRTGRNTQHSLAALLRQSIYSRLADYDDTNDAERLAVDPTMRHVAGERVIERSGASTSVMGRFETEILTQPRNLERLMNLVGEWINRVHQLKSLRHIILDMDSFVNPTYGNKEGSAYNGFFGCTCYHPLFYFNRCGDLERALLRNGSVHSADDWRRLLEPIVNRYRSYDILRFFRGDATFANPEMYHYLEAEGYFYAIRLKENPILHENVKHMLTRPVGRPPKKPIVRYHSFGYQASWEIPLRIVAKIKWHA